MFFNFGMKFQASKLELEAPEFGMKFQGSKSEIEAPESKTDILHCKMYVFFNFWNEFSMFQTWNWSTRIKNIHFTL